MLGILYGVLLTIHVIVALLLIAVVLLQAGRGGGIAEIFGGRAERFLGTSANIFLKRATTTCAIVFFCTSLSLALISAQRARSIVERIPGTPAQVEPQTQPTPPQPEPASEPPKAPVDASQ